MLVVGALGLARLTRARARTSTRPREHTTHVPRGWDRAVLRQEHTGVGNKAMRDTNVSGRGLLLLL